MGALQGVTTPAFRMAFVLAAVLLAALTGRAQEQEYQPPPPAYPLLFPQPTGQNGYEEIVLAGDLARRAEEDRPPKLNLAQMREALAGRDSQEALGLLRAGLAKPITLPRQEIEPNIGPEYAGLRALARLLSLQQYVLLADGRGRDAIAVTEEGMRLGQLVRAESMIGALVGTAVEAIVLTRLVTHQEQWSVRDCDRIQALCEGWLRTEDPAIAAMEQERRYSITTIHNLLTDPEKYGKDLQEYADDSFLPELRRLQQDTAARTALAARLSARINAEVDRNIAVIRDPALAPSAPKPTLATTLEDQIAALYMPAYELGVVKFCQTRINKQLLAVYAALRRYRWENNNTLPETLAELRVPPALATDPFTRQPFHYKRTSSVTCELWSAGAPRSDGGSGRARITFPWTRPPE